jgi:hypothetical protein
MATFGAGFLEKRLFARSVRRWMRAAEDVQTAPMFRLRQFRQRARLLRSHLDAVIDVADDRLSAPFTNLPDMPHTTEWTWRPDLWRIPLSDAGRCGVEQNTRFDDQISLFHDCPLSEIIIRQTRNKENTTSAPCALGIEVFGFEGTFLSLVTDLPEAGVAGLNRGHLVRLDMLVDIDRPIEIYARLNVRHGPNTEQVVRQVPLDQQEIAVEFDLAYSELNEKRVENAWVDLIINDPSMNTVVLRDLIVSRRPRAAL